MVPNQANVEDNQPFQSHGHTQEPLQPQTCMQGHCPGETGLDPFVSFPCRFEMSVVKCSITFQSPDLLILCEFIWQEAMQLVSG